MAHHLQLGSLDINDGTTYCLNHIEFPTPAPRIEWIDPAHKDGQQYAAHKYENRDISITMSIMGATDTAISTAIHNLWEELTKTENVLEWQPDGWADTLYFDTFLAEETDISNWFIDYIREGRHTRGYFLADMVVTMKAKPFARGDEEEFVIFEQLAPNGDMENWTGGAPDGWTETTAGGSTITEETTEVWHGDSSCELNRGTGNCAIMTTDFIPVDKTLHYHLDCFAKSDTGTPDLGIGFQCYDVAHAPVGPITPVFLDSIDDEWMQRAHIGSFGTGIINPAGGIPADFHDDTVYVKLTIWNATDSSIIYIDQIYFGCSEYSCTNRVESPAGIVIPGTNFVGEMPSACDVYMDEVFWENYAVFLGQRKEYHEDFCPICEPFDTGSPPASSSVASNVCYTQDYENYDVAGNLILNWSFESWSVGPVGANTDDADNWTETRTSVGTGYMGGSTDAHSGDYSMRWHQASPAQVWSADVETTATISVVEGETYRLSLWSKRTSFGSGLQLHIEMDYYIGAGFFGGTWIDTFYPNINTYAKKEYDITIPAGGGIDGVKFRIGVSSTNFLGDIWLDDVWFGVLSSASVGDCEWELDAHKGIYLPTANISVETGDPTNSELTLAGDVVSNTLGAITDETVQSIADFGDPDTDWVSVALLEDRWDVVRVPTHHISDHGDWTALNQRLRLVLSESYNDALDFYVDFIALIPIDQAIMQATLLSGVDHLIIDSRSDNRILMTSLDGTLDSATILDGSKWIGDPDFQVDPEGGDVEGVNMVWMGIYNNDNSYEPRPVMDIKLKYTPLYIFVADT